MFWLIVDKNYQVDVLAEVNIDSQLPSAYELLERGVTLSTLRMLDINITPVRTVPRQIVR